MYCSVMPKIKCPGVVPRGALFSCGVTSSLHRKETAEDRQERLRQQKQKYEVSLIFFPTVYNLQFQAIALVF